MTGGSAVVGHQDVPALGAPVGDARHEAHLPLVGRTAVQPADHPLRVVAVGRVGPEQPGMQEPVVIGCDDDDFGFDQQLTIPRSVRDDVDGGAPGGLASRVEVDDNQLCGRPRSRTNGSDAVDAGRCGPRELTMHTAPDLVHATRADVDDAQSAESRLVPRERHPAARRVDGVRPLAEPPRRSGVLDGLVDQRRVAQPHVQPSGVVAHACQRPIGREARLLGGSAAGLRSMPAPAAIEPRPLEPRVVPGHAGHVPGLPHHRGGRRVDGWVEAEVSRAVVEPPSLVAAPNQLLGAASPTPGLIDDVDDVPAIGRADRRLRHVLGTVCGEPIGGAAVDRLPPQVAVDGGVHDR